MTTTEDSSYFIFENGSLMDSNSLPEYYEITTMNDYYVEVNVSRKPGTTNSSLTVKTFSSKGGEEISSTFKWFQSSETQLKRPLPVELNTLDITPKDLNRRIILEVHPITASRFSGIFLLEYGPIRIANSTHSNLSIAMRNGYYLIECEGIIKELPENFYHARIDSLNLVFMTERRKRITGIRINSSLKISSSYKDELRLDISSPKMNAQLKMRNREERDTFMLFLQYYVRESKKRSSSSLDLSIVSFKKKGSIPRIAAVDDVGPSTARRDELQARIKELESDLELTTLQRNELLNDIFPYYESTEGELVQKLKEFQEKIFALEQVNAKLKNSSFRMEGDSPKAQNHPLNNIEVFGRQASQNNELEESNKSLRDALETLKGEFVQMEGYIKKLESENNDLSQIKSKANSSDLEKQLAMKEKQFNDLKQEYEAYVSKMEENMDNMFGLNNIKVDELENENISIYQDGYEDWTPVRRTLMNFNVEIPQELKFDNLEEILNSALTVHRAKLQECDKMNQEIINLREEKIKLLRNSERQSEDTDLPNIEDLNSMRMSMGDLQGRLEYLEEENTRLRDVNNELSEIQDRLLKSERRASELTEANRHLSEKKREIESSYQQFRKEVAGQQDSTLMMVDRLREQLQEANMINNKLEMELEVSKKRAFVDDVRSSVGKAEDSALVAKELGLTKKKLEETEKKIEELEAKLELVNKIKEEKEEYIGNLEYINLKKEEQIKELESHPVRQHDSRLNELEDLNVNAQFNKKGQQNERLYLSTVEGGMINKKKAVSKHASLLDESIEQDNSLIQTQEKQIAELTVQLKELVEREARYIEKIEQLSSQLNSSLPIVNNGGDSYLSDSVLTNNNNNENQIILILQQENNRLKTSVREDEVKITLKDEEITELGNAIATMSKENTELRNMVEERDDRIAELEEDKNTLLSEFLTKNFESSVCSDAQLSNY